MGSRFASYSFLFYVLLVSQCTQAAMDHHLRILAQQGNYDGHKGMHGEDASLHIFFTVNDLKVGKRIPLYFSIKDPSTSPHLLPREEADSIPFSSAQLPELLEFFSFSKDSPQAKAMKYTLGECEAEPVKGESKFCATSLESMLDSARGFFGFETQFKVLNTKHLSKRTPLFQNYTILEVPKEISAAKMVACHTMPYPYAVFYCHGQESDRKVFELLLGGDNGERVEAVGVCHMDTSRWDSNHAAFRVLKIQPGGSPVCHSFPADNLIWVASPTII